jgi:hypothetical protein
MAGDVELLVPIGIELHAALLLVHSAVVLFWIERETGEVCFHGKWERWRR